MIAGMIPLSIALDTTGTADAIALGIFRVSGGLSPLWMAALLMGLAVVVGLFLSGQTAAIIVAPIAISAAAPTGADPRALCMAVAIGCSLAFISPFGHPANLIVMGPGGYAVRDYLRLGIPLTIISILLAIVGLSLVWGL
jgi:di/tricarboxylate transporter